MKHSRHSPIEMSKDEFKEIGRKLIDDIADFYAGIRDRPVTPGETPEQLQLLLKDFLFTERGTDPGPLLANTAKLLFDHSLLNGPSQVSWLYHFFSRSHWRFCRPPFRRGKCKCGG